MLPSSLPHLHSTHALPHVLLQCGVLAEGCATVVTLEYLPSFFPVYLHVSGQLAALGAGIGTQVTLVRFLPRVTASVHCQVTAVFKNFPTKFTSVQLSVAQHIFTIFSVNKGLNLTLVHDRSNHTGLHRRQVGRQEEGFLGYLDLLIQARPVPQAGQIILLLYLQICVDN